MREGSLIKTPIGKRDERLPIGLENSPLENRGMRDCRVESEWLRVCWFNALFMSLGKEQRKENKKKLKLMSYEG